MTRSLTVWFRIEPLSDVSPPGPDRALQARVYDPAWLLGRQWQLGELTGEDAASPAWVRLRMAGAPLTRFQRGESGGGVHTIDRSDVLEPLVEAEPPDPDGDWAAAVAAGDHFLAALGAAGLDGLVADFRAEYPVADPDPVGTDPAAATRYRVVRRTGLDGAALAAAIRPTGGDGPARLPVRPPVDQPQRDPLLAVLRRWLEWYPPPPPASDTAWVPERLEYRFTVAGPSPTSDGEIVWKPPPTRAAGLTGTTSAPRRPPSAPVAPLARPPTTAGPAGCTLACRRG